MTFVVTEEIDFREFVTRLKNKTGLDLMSYKQEQLRRRLSTFRNRHGYRTFVELYQALDQNELLYKAFMDHLTINVTEFFRNPDRWGALRNQVLPDILSRTTHLKCWSAACSTGEEPYSIALTVADVTALSNLELHATDLDRTVLEKAKLGIYPDAALKSVPAEKRGYFTRVSDGQVQVVEDIRKQIRFRQHNLLADPFEKGYDLIVCRNVMIYFGEAAKSELYHKFAGALSPGGYLFVGGTEQIMYPAEFGFVSRGMFFYQKA